MCAHGPITADKSPRVEEQESHEASGLPRHFEEALKELGSAIASKKVEPICTSYLALRRAGHAMPLHEFVSHIESAHGRTAQAVVISAFSHRKCFMCEDGGTVCQTCHGSGQVDRFMCPQCDGLGLQPCTFCLGTSWNDPNEVPGELRKGVFRRQVAHVEKDAARLSKLPDVSKLKSAGSFSPAKRGQIVSWLVRLRARLNSLTGSPVDSEANRAVRYEALGRRIGGILEALVPTHAAPPDEDDEDEI